MSNSEIANLYKHVIDEVIRDLRNDFEANAIDEDTLQDLKRIWIEKLARTNVANFGWMNEQQDSVGLPMMPAAPGLLDPLPNSGLGPGLGLLYPQVGQEMGMHHQDNDSGLMLPGSHSLNQTDGPQDFSFEVELPREEAKAFMKKVIRQEDGPGDSDLEGFGGKEEGNESDQINLDLDDSEDDLKSGDENDNMDENYIICLYDKVQRVKNKWKFNLKDGIASINGKDYGFSKATGESDW